jgi:hypothetical protein
MLKQVNIEVGDITEQIVECWERGVTTVILFPNAGRMGLRFIGLLLACRSFLSRKFSNPNRAGSVEQ